MGEILGQGWHEHLHRRGTKGSALAYDPGLAISGVQKMSVHIQKKHSYLKNASWPNYLVWDLCDFGGDAESLEMLAKKNERSELLSRYSAP